MKTATLKEIKTELKHRSPLELEELCLRLSRFKKENKELITYILFESGNEESYINGVRAEMDELFDDVNIASTYYLKKSFRKILKLINTRIRYSQNKQTEVELLIYYCDKLLNFSPSISGHIVLENIYQRQFEKVNKKISTLHEDLRFDYQLIIENMNDVWKNPHY